MKKLMLFASLAMAAAAFAVPSTASAIWTDNHKHILQGVNPQIHGIGTAAFTSAAGGIHCSEVTATVQLTGGQTTATTTQFTPTLSSCKTNGGLAQCTITSITVENTPWLAHIQGTVINQTNVTITNHLHGLFCPQKLQLHSTAQDLVIIQPEETDVKTPDGQVHSGTGKHTLITGLDIGGEVTLTGPNGECLGTATASGTIGATPTSSHRYGFT